MIYCVASTKQSRNKTFTVTSPHNVIAFVEKRFTLVTIICIMIVLLYRQFAEKKNPDKGHVKSTKGFVP